MWKERGCDNSTEAQPLNLSCAFCCCCCCVSPAATAVCISHTHTYTPTSHTHTHIHTMQGARQVHSLMDAFAVSEFLATFGAVCGTPSLNLVALQSAVAWPLDGPELTNVYVALIKYLLAQWVSCCWQGVLFQGRQGVLCGVCFLGGAGGSWCTTRAVCG